MCGRSGIGDSYECRSRCESVDLIDEHTPYCASASNHFRAIRRIEMRGHTFSACLAPIRPQPNTAIRNFRGAEVPFPFACPLVIAIFGYFLNMFLLEQVFRKVLDSGSKKEGGISMHTEDYICRVFLPVRWINRWSPISDSVNPQERSDIGPE